MYLCIDHDIPILSLEKNNGMFFLFLFLSFIDDFYLRLEATFKLHAHFQWKYCQKKMNHSHNAKNKVMQQRLRWQNRLISNMNSGRTCTVRSILVIKYHQQKRYATAFNMDVTVCLLSVDSKKIFLLNKCRLKSTKLSLLPRTCNVQEYFCFICIIDNFINQCHIYLGEADDPQWKASDPKIRVVT